MDNEIVKNIQVTIYGNLEKYNEVISKGRCRIFYKYGNRNGTYITDEFADILLSSIPYAPVKGIYDNFDEDYTDHGAKRSLGRIYGIVPENPNLSWEKHLDEDGVEREYACVDVLIFTGLYEEANQIVGKSQSMELYDKSIEGEWQIIDGKKYFVYKKGCFLGLQVLGDEVEPCFEGASFFSLLAPIKELINDYEKYKMIFQKKGGHEMHKLNFKLSDNEKFDAIWSLLNTNYTEEGGWLVDYGICDVYDNYAVVRNYNEGIYERVYYTKDDSTDSVVLGERVRCYIVDVTQDEKVALEALQKINGGTYEKIDENYSNAIGKNSSYEQKIGELNNSISTLTTERDEVRSSLDSANEELETVRSEYSDLKKENESLVSFKVGVEKAEKQEIINSYSDKLSADVIEKYNASIENYTASDLKKELAYELVQSNPTIFTKNPANGYVPKDEEPKGGIEEILSKYRK